MARTITEIQADILTAIASDPALSGNLTSTSVTAVWRLWAYVVAASIWTLEVLMDTFRLEVAEIAAAGKAHTARWYRQKALDYQHGGTLAVGLDTYDNSALTAAQIVAQKIVKAASVTDSGGLLVIKLAKETSGNLAALSVGELNAATAYMNDVKDAGVPLSVLSVAGDKLKVSLTVYYDPTILSSTGARLDGTNSTPIQSAIKSFLKDTPFDGVFVKSALVDAVQQVQGVISPDLTLCEARRNDAASYSAVGVFYTPYSGYLVFNNESTDLLLTFVAV